MSRVTEPFKVAALEFNPKPDGFDRNVERASDLIREAAANGARLIVLPETCLSGFHPTPQAYLPDTDTLPGKATDAFAEITREYNCYVAFGMVERDSKTSLLFNAAGLVGPDGYIGKYRKVGHNAVDVMVYAPGNTGHPVFETELGTLGIVICYDDTWWEPARLAALKGADIIAYVCTSGKITEGGAALAASNHWTIAACQYISTWNGLAMVASDRSNSEKVEALGVTRTFGGSASVWQADGSRSAHSAATTGNNNAANPNSILYGEIDPALYDNDQKATLNRRRPELYTLLGYFRSPVDVSATRQSTKVDLAALQYAVTSGDSDGNARRAQSLIEELAATNTDPGLVVLPAFSVAGSPADEDEARQRAEPADGRTVKLLGDFASQTGKHVVGSYIELSEDGQLFHTVALITPKDTVAGQYRQTHLDPSISKWATPGDQLAVFPTEIGRIGLLTCEDVRFPEAAGVMEVSRADLIAVPTHWDGNYGGPLQDAIELFQVPYPSNTMNQWYSVAKMAQAYTVVANAIGDNCQGSSGVFTINPVNSDEPPVVGSVDDTEVVRLTVNTLGEPNWWMSQAQLIAGRRADLAVPMTLAHDSEAFQQWKNSPGFDICAWAPYHE